MSVVSVRAQNFILALFIRDDGERFLLGDNGYDFIDSQLHFVGNSIENDEVAKQGTDGVMLAGQVRRASVQTFDGYVGDATTPKEEIEQMRRAFIAFFLKGHHYRVVYVDCARNAWQRKGGYLVDAPEVKELFQVHPEYHVGLNFEDVNYYSYDENAEGDEITANLVQVAISSAVEGGLVWDEDGAVSENATVEYITETAQASGKSISISDAVNAPLASFQLDGETSQNGTPTPDAPIPVKTVTGENVVKISDGQGNEQSYEVNLGKNLYDKSASTDGKRLDANGGEYTDSTFTLSAYIPVEPNTKYTLSGMPGSSYGHVATYDSSKTFVGRWYVGSDPFTFTTQANARYIRIATPLVCKDSTQCEQGSQATSYAAYFEPIELCKLGNAQDYIFKSGDKWYVHKAVGKLNCGDYTWSWDSSIPRVSLNTASMGVVPPGGNQYPFLAYSNKFKADTFTHVYTEKNNGMALSTSGFISLVDTSWTSQAEANSDIQHAVIYYALQLAYRTDTEITNEALIEQLEAILAGGTFAGTNNIALIPSGNEQGSLEITYYTKYIVNITAGGYEWEQGGSGGPTIVMNESIDNVYPIWTITGPITNPVLENTTTGEQIEYVGTIGEGQKLIIDMGAQTALLDGLNVLSNVVGEFISLAPGANTLLYSVSNGDTASEIGWSEIVG